MTPFKQQAQYFNRLSESDKWKYILEHKAEIELFLDNDYTFGKFLLDEPNEENDYDPASLHFNSWLGNSTGVLELLKAIGIKAQRC